MKIALVMVTENEEMFLKRHIHIFKRLFDGFFVFDNNSTDGTVDILKEHGVEYCTADFGHGVDWQEQHSKNTVLAYAEAKGFDWAMSLDADELIFENDALLIRRYMAHPENSFLMFPRIELYGDLKHHRPNVYPDYQGRGIKLNQGYLWQKPIHSVIYRHGSHESAMEEGLHTIVSNVNIYHYGWALAPERRFKRYYPGADVPNFLEVQGVTNFYGRLPL